jgi:BlaI family transcriptional regulator, penicillinase repressor
MAEKMNPTERELEILKVLWDRGEATVRDVYEELRQRLPIVQNTVQAFLRTMEDKGLVTHRLEGRTFIYQPTYQRQQTTQRMAEQLLTRAFDGAMDQLVQSVLSLRQPTKDELARLEQLLAEAKANKGKSSRK